MAFDGIVTKSIVKEMQNIIGSKIDKIYEPDKNTIILGLYLNGKNYALNICIDSHNCRMNLTTHQKVNPLVAPNFCMLLRKHLIGGRIVDFSMLGLERLVEIKIETINEFNEVEIKKLVVEIMGKHSNIILVNQEEKIIDSIRHIDSKNSYREILPSRIYVYPKSDKSDFTKLKSFDEFKEKISNADTAEEGDIGKIIANTFTGFSYSFAKSAVRGRDLKQTYQYICKIIDGKENLKFELIYKDEKISDYILKLSDTENSLFYLNFFVDDFYFEKEITENFKNYRNTILKMILETLKKYNKRLANINIKLNECNDMDKYKLYGELITANLYKLPNNHLESIEVTDIENNINKLDIDGLFIAIGNIPDNKRFENIVLLDSNGYIVTDDNLCTKTNDIYVVGDTRVKTLRQLATATADGAIAATEIIKKMED